MDHLALRDARLRITRWIEEGASVLGVLPGLFDEHERLRTALEALESEAGRLRRELHDAREEITTLRHDNDTLRRERDEVAEVIADGVTRLMNDALKRLRAPLAASGHERAEPRAY